MKVLVLQNFGKVMDGNGSVIYQNAYNFSSNLNKPITIKKNSKIALLHAEVNPDTPPLDNSLVFINLGNLPINTNVGTAIKGRESNIVGIARVGNSNDDIIFNNEYVDLNNQEDITITNVQVQILDTDLQLKTALGEADDERRQTIVLGIKECDCKRR